MKVLPKRMSKNHITAISITEMAVDQKAHFEKAVDALLADLICGLDRHIEGNSDELNRKQMEGQRRDRCRAPKR